MRKIDNSLITQNEVDKMTSAQLTAFRQRLRTLGRKHGLTLVQTKNHAVPNPYMVWHAVHGIVADDLDLLGLRDRLTELCR